MRNGSSRIHLANEAPPPASAIAHIYNRPRRYLILVVFAVSLLIFGSMAVMETPSREFSPKLSPALRTALATGDRERYPVVIRVIPLSPPLSPSSSGSRPDSAALVKRQADFEHYVKTITDVLHRTGGKNVRHLWIADAVSAEASAAAIEAIARLDLVREIYLDDKRTVIATRLDHEE